MRFPAYIILMFGISLSLYFLGYQPIAVQMLAQGSSPVKINCEGTAICEDQTVIIGSIFFFLIAAAALITLVTGFSAIYVIPIFILLAVLNFFVLPMNFMMSVTEPLIKYPVLALLNTLTVLAVINFIRGGS